MSEFPIVLTNNDKISNSSYKYAFPYSVNLEDFSLAVSDVNIYYSWYSISSVLNNNKFEIYWPSGVGNLTYGVTIPDGSYTVGQLNSFLQSYFITNGLYLTNNTTGNNVYYMEFVENSTAYRVQLNSYPVPTSLPSGFTNGGMPAFPTVSRQPQLNVINSNNFYQIIGFSSGVYPPTQTSTTYNKNGDLVPQLSPVSSVLMHCSVVNNPYSSSNQLIHIFTAAGVEYGSMISSIPPSLNFVPCNGNVSEITINFTDQNYLPLNIIDSSLTIKLVLRKNFN